MDAFDERMTIAEVARTTGLSVHTIRYYERAGLLPPIQRTSSGHRRFSAEDAEWIALCTRLRSTGMSISRIRDAAGLLRAGEGNEAEQLALLQEHREDVIRRLGRARQELEMTDAKIAHFRASTGQEHDQ